MIRRLYPCERWTRRPHNPYLCTYEEFRAINEYARALSAELVSRYTRD